MRECARWIDERHPPSPTQEPDRPRGHPGLLDVYAVYFSPTQGWTFYLQLTVNGIILGSVYALIALGYTMVYGILKLLNFAHGDVFMVGAFIGFGVLTLLGGALQPGDPAWPRADRALHVRRGDDRLGLLGVAIERFAYRPLRNAPRIAPLISALGVVVLPRELDAAALRIGVPRPTTASTSSRYNGIHIGGVNGVFVRTSDHRHRQRGRADGRALAPRPLDAARQGDARGRRSTARPRR